MGESNPPGPTHVGCSNHPGSDAVARCVSCNRLLCAYCRVVRGNRNYCRACASCQPDPPAVQAPPRQPAYYGQGYSPGGEYGYPPPPGTPQQPPYGYPTYMPAARYHRPREVVFPGAPWGVGEAMLIFAIAFVAASALSLVLYFLFDRAISVSNAPILLIFLSSVVLYSFLIGGTLYSVKVRHRSTVTALGLKFDGMWKGIAWGVGLGLPLFVAAIFLAYASERLLRDTSAPDMVSESVNRVSSGGVNGGLIFLLFVTLVVLAPVCEEIFFRGYLYPALRNRMDRQPAMLLNGLLFAAVHFEIVGFLPRFLLGYGLCYMYERQHNLSGPVVGHAIYNGLILLLAGIFQLF